MKPKAKIVGITTLRLRVDCPPLVVWRWGSWLSVLTGLSIGAMTVIAAISLDLYLRGEADGGMFYMIWFFLPAVPFLFSFQRVEFDNHNLIVRISYWMLIPVWRVSIPYAGVKGIGTDWQKSKLIPGADNPRIDLYLYTRSRRGFLLSTHYTEWQYRKAVDHILRHVTFRVLRWE